MCARLLRRLLLTSALVVAFLVLAPKVAFAQAAITIYQEQSLPRVNANGDTINKRALQYTPEGVSYQDCVDDIRISFPLQMSGFVGNASLQAWASLSGADCSQQTARNAASGTRVCWQLVSGIPLTTTQTVNIPVRDIMSGALGATTLDNTAAICGKVDLTTIGVQFLYFNPGDTATAAVNKTVSVQLDTVGPAPPTGVRTKPGNGRVTVEWDNISGEGGVSVLTGVRVYCDVNGSAGIPTSATGGNASCDKLITERAAAAANVTSDAGTTTDASTTTTSVSPACTTVPIDGGDGATEEICDDDAGATSSSSSSGSPTTCSSTNIAPTDGTTVTPSDAFNGCFACGEITGNTGTTVVAEAIRGTTLTNNQTYTLAVASTDAFNNVGPLSSVVCDYPEETNDFWANYRSSGGQAGGGCATSGETPFGSLGALGGVAALVASMLRRRRNTK